MVKVAGAHARSTICTPVWGMGDQNLTGRRTRSLRALAGAALVLSMHAVVAPAIADELIVDDADSSVQVSGSWQTSATTPGFYGGGYLFHMPGGGAASVRWPFPGTGTAGQYRVYTRWSSGANRTAAAAYQISSQDGNRQVQINQTSGGGQWRLLGTFSFAPGANEGVTLAGQADGVVVADAIAWVGPLGSDAATDLVDPAAAQSVQGAVDAGDQPWRLDPLEVARADARAFGISPGDPMQLVHEEAGAALVRCQHAGKTYEIELKQPARLGPSGIWVVTTIR